MNLEPVDADPDIFWMRSGMYFRPCRISTGREDNLVMPNLVVVREGLPSISIYEYMRALQRTSLPLNGQREDGEVGVRYGSVPRVNQSGAQDQNLSGTIHYPEAQRGGFVQPVFGAAGVLSSFGATINMDYVPTASAVHHIPQSWGGLPGESHVSSPWGGVPAHSFSPSKGCQVFRPKHPYPRPPATGIPAPSQPSAGVRKHSQAFDPLDHELLSSSTQAASKKPRTLFAGVRYQDRPSAGTSPFVAPPPRAFPPPNHAISRPTLTKTQNMPPPPIPSRQPSTHPLPHIPNQSKNMATNSSTSLVRDPEGIRAVMPDEASRRESVRDFDINAARMCFARLAASQRKEREKMEALERGRRSWLEADL